MTGFAKTGLIAGVRNCSYSPFWSAKSIFFDFIFSLKNTKYDAFAISPYNYSTGRAVDKGLNLPRSRNVLP